MDSIQKLRRDLAPYFPSFEGTRDLGRGTAYPATGAVPGGLQDGDRFFRTDMLFGAVYQAVGPRWLTRHEYSADFTPNPLAGAPTTAAPNDLLIAPMRTDYSIYITKVKAIVRVATTNDASNYYTLLLRSS